MDGDEAELKPAGEEADDEQNVGAVPQRLGQRLLEGLRLARPRGRPAGGLVRPRRADRKRQRNDQQHQHGKDLERRLPAECIDQADAQRREQELPERTGCRAGAERRGAPAFRQELAERRDDQVERTAREPEADQDAARQIEHGRGRRLRHHEQAGSVEQCAGDDHANHAEAVRERAGERLRGAVQQRLHRDRERKHLASPAVRIRHRRQEQAERRARPETDHGDETAAHHDDGRRAPVALQSCGRRNGGIAVHGSNRSGRRRRGPRHRLLDDRQVDHRRQQARTGSPATTPCHTSRCARTTRRPARPRENRRPDG